MNNEEKLKKVTDILINAQKHNLGCLTSCRCCQNCEFKKDMYEGCYEKKGIKLALEELSK